jgi:hypothetical protein
MITSIHHRCEGQSVEKWSQAETIEGAGGDPMLLSMVHPA